MKSGKDICGLSFLKFKNQGRPYIRAYRNSWVPKQVLDDGTEIGGHSKPTEQHQVGALLGDNRVKMSKKFVAKFPGMADEIWYFFNNDLVDEETYFAEAGQEHLPSLTVAEAQFDQDLQDEDAEQERTEKGFLPQYALAALANQSGITRALQETFDKKKAAQFLDFIYYLVLNPGSSADQFDDWAYHQYVSPASETLDGKKISRLLQECSQEKWDQFWRLRYEQLTKKRIESGRETKRFCALDSTSIGTYADLGDAAYGHAKQDEGLPQINLVMVVDQFTGETVYAFTYEGSVNDRATYDYVVQRMTSVGFPMDEIFLVTDRGYSSMFNMQSLLNEGIHFVTGVTIAPKSIDEKLIFQHRNHIIDNHETRNSLHGVYQFSTKEVWNKKQVHVHIYYNPELAQQAIDGFNDRLCTTLAILNAGKKLDSRQWEDIRSYLRQEIDPKSEPHKEARKIWVANQDEVRRFKNRAGFFIIKTDVISDPTQALALYRQRNTIEMGFNQLKNHLGGRRLRVQERSHLGKLLAFIIGASLRVKIRFNYEHHKELHPATKMEIPGNSVDRLLSKLGRCTIIRKKKSEYWQVKPIPKKARDWLEVLFQAKAPPTKFR